MKRVLGEEYPNTVLCLGNLALMYHHEQRLREAGVLVVMKANIEQLVQAIPKHSLQWEILL